MIRPILSLNDPYADAGKLIQCGWKLDFSNPPESDDPLVGVSLYDNQLLLGVADERYIVAEEKPYAGAGIQLYLTIPKDKIKKIYKQHKGMQPSELSFKSWGVIAFEFKLYGYKFMIAAE